MKFWKYKIIVSGESPDETAAPIEPVILDKMIPYSAANEKIAAAEAYNGEYEIIDDGEPEPVVPPTTTELEASLASVQSASAIAFVALCEAGTLDETTAGEHAELFSPWTYPVDYKAGNIRAHGGKLYRCLQDHTSQADWTPDVSASLWSVAADPTEEWPAWSQPVGAHDAYAAGDKVSHNGKHWTSDANGNVWEPGVYGWTEYTE